MITGILGIKFKDVATDEDIKNVISEIYSRNSAMIAGMVYLEFKEAQTLDNVLAFAEGYNNRIQKVRPQQNNTLLAFQEA